MRAVSRRGGVIQGIVTPDRTEVAPGEERPPDAPPSGATLPRGTAVGRYVLLGKLGAGGMGVVYAAHDPELDRKVALKLLLAPSQGGLGTEGRTRLRREALALARLSHPNVVAVHDVGTWGAHDFIAMEFVDGRTLRAWAGERPRGWQESLRVLVEIARAVAAAHAAGLVHRDLKPDNVMIDREDRVRVMDFGLAHGRPSATTMPEPERPRQIEVSDNSALSLQLTAAGLVQGTPTYMAPEQWYGQETGPPADQFGWSVVAWELLHGERPFVGDTIHELATAVTQGDRRPPPRGRAVPAWLRRVIERGLEPDPARRWPSMQALLAALTRGQARRRIVATAVVVAVIVAAIVGDLGLRRWRHAQKVAACEAAGREIAEIWRPEAQTRLREAFAATGVAYAGTAVDKVAPWLDRRASAWQAARVEACTQAEVERAWDRELYERALACLDERRVELKSLLAELEHPDEKVVQRAVGAVTGTIDASTCRDVDALRRRPVPPVDASATIATIRGELARAAALDAAGRYEAALAVATAAREAAQTLGWAPLTAAAQRREAHELTNRGKLEEAEAAGAAAFFAAGRAGAWDTAAEAAITMIRVVGYKLRRPNEGRQWGRLAELALAHANDPLGLREGRRLVNLVHVEEDVGAFAAAQALAERALALHEAALGADHPTIATDLDNLGGLNALTGQLVEARRMFERSVVITEEALGPEHPDLALTLNNLANVAQQEGQLGESRVLLERALAILERAMGPEHPDVASALTNLANTRMMQGDNAAALALFERALAIRERVLGPAHPDVAIALASLAMVREATGALTESVTLLEQALKILETAVGPDHPDVATTRTNLGNAYIRVGRRAEAQPQFVAALASREKTFGADHPALVATLVGLGDIAIKQRRFDEARSHLRRALTIVETALGPEHPLIAPCVQSLAEVQLAAGEIDAAVAGLERALVILAKQPTRTDEADARFALARALVARDPARALTEAGKARDALRDAGAAEPLAEVEAWLAAHPERPRRR